MPEPIAKTRVILPIELSATGLFFGPVPGLP